MPEQPPPADNTATINNDTAETWDHLCGPDPNGQAALESGCE
jgi:hypothetical protein